MKAIILNDTYVSGTPVFTGEVVDVDKTDLQLLTSYQKAVELDQATDEHKKLVEARKAAIKNK